MTDSNGNSPQVPSGDEHIELVDLPDTFDDGDRRRFTDMLNWINTAMLVTCNRVEPDPTEPLPLQLIGQAIPPPLEGQPQIHNRALYSKGGGGIEIVLLNRFSDASSP